MTQTGGFTIYDENGDGVSITTGPLNLTANVVNIGADLFAGIFAPNGELELQGETVLIEGATGVVIAAPTSSVNFDCRVMGFFNHVGVTQPSSGGTLTGLIAALVSLGLISS